MNSTICMIFAILGMLATVAAQQRPNSAPANDTEQILAAEHAWAQAAVNANTAHMASFMFDDYLELTLNTDPAKSEWIDLIRSGEEKYESVHLSNLTVHLHGNVATVTGEFTQKGTRGHEDIVGAVSQEGVGPKTAYRNSDPAEPTPHSRPSVFRNTCP